VLAGDGLTGGGTLNTDVTLSLSDTGPGAGEYGGGGDFVEAITLDDYGRVTALTVAEAGGGGYATIERPNGTPVTQRSIMSFTTEFTVADNTDTTDISLATNGIAYSKIQQGAAVTVLGVAGTSGANIAEIQAASGDTVLRRAGGGGLDFGKVVSAMTGGFTDTQVILGQSGGNIAGSSALLYDSNRRFVSTGATVGLQQTGGTGGATSLQCESFGTRIASSGGDLHDLYFTGSATTRQIRFEGRSSEYKAGSPSFHIGNSNLGNPTIAIGDNIIRSHQHLNMTLFSVSYAGITGSGLGVLGIANATTNPSANPSGGVVHYVDGGVHKILDSTGMVTNLN
jgi:hypothetical protein